MPLFALTNINIQTCKHIQSPCTCLVEHIQYMCVCSPIIFSSLRTRNGVLCGKPLNIYLDVSPSSCVCVCVCQLWIQAFPRFFHNCYHLSLSSLCCRAAFPEVESQQLAFFLLSHSFFLFIYLLLLLSFLAFEGAILSNYPSKICRQCHHGRRKQDSLIRQTQIL